MQDPAFRHILLPLNQMLLIQQLLSTCHIKMLSKSVMSWLSLSMSQSSKLSHIKYITALSCHVMVDISIDLCHCHLNSPLKTLCILLYCLGSTFIGTSFIKLTTNTVSAVTSMLCEALTESQIVLKQSSSCLTL